MLRWGLCNPKFSRTANGIPLNTPERPVGWWIPWVTPFASVGFLRIWRKTWDSTRECTGYFGRAEPAWLFDPRFFGNAVDWIAGILRTWKKSICVGAYSAVEKSCDRFPNRWCIIWVVVRWPTAVLAKPISTSETVFLRWPKTSTPRNASPKFLPDLYWTGWLACILL